VPNLARQSIGASEENQEQQDPFPVGGLSLDLPGVQNGRSLRHPDEQDDQLLCECN